MFERDKTKEVLEMKNIEEYTQLIMDVIAFDTADVIATSGISLPPDVAIRWSIARNQA